MEDLVQQNIELLDKDENFRATYFSLIERFYILFESIFKYYQDLNVIIEEINSGVFIQYTIENILQDEDGKQVFSECFYLYGVMLFLLDNLITGAIRERIVIFYIRYKVGMERRCWCLLVLGRAGRDREHRPRRQALPDDRVHPREDEQGRRGAAPALPGAILPEVPTEQ